MSRTILNEFGPDTPKLQAPRITKNGPVSDRDVLNYQDPQGPRHNYSPGAGLRGGTNFGNAGSQGKGAIFAEASGRPGDLTTHNFDDGFDNDDEDELNPKPGGY